MIALVHTIPRHSFFCHSFFCHAFVGHLFLGHSPLLHDAFLGIPRIGFHSNACVKRGGRRVLFCQCGGAKHFGDTLFGLRVCSLHLHLGLVHLLLCVSLQLQQHKQLFIFLKRNSLIGRTCSSHIRVERFRSNVLLQRYFRRDVVTCALTLLLTVARSAQLHLKLLECLLVLLLAGAGVDFMLTRKIATALLLHCAFLTLHVTAADKRAGAVCVETIRLHISTLRASDTRRQHLIAHTLSETLIKHVIDPLK
mmetsp:Transcript_19146/g.30507  ORF Transcript_19146/g.30507 Transcript_19146/m.30507 type:complete len:252 (-) Transcript_19146:11-766(-)